jgi:hypothetical protein
MNKSQVKSLLVGVGIGIFLRSYLNPYGTSQQTPQNQPLKIDTTKAAISMDPASNGSGSYSNIVPSPALVVIPAAPSGGAATISLVNDVAFDPDNIDDDTLCRNTQECVDRYGPTWYCLNGRCVEVVPVPPEEIPVSPEFRALFPHIYP